MIITSKRSNQNQKHIQPAKQFFLLGKLLTRHDPDAPLINGDTYVFDTKSSGMLIRMLMETTDGTGYLALAHNERYKQILFPRSEILNIFTIVGLVRVK